ncbi:MAG: hypothetical protein ABSF23_07980 [Terracidiphilus sp.]
MTPMDRERNSRSDLEKINAAADLLNTEAMDILAYQADLFEEVELDEESLKVVVRVPISDTDIER